MSALGALLADRSAPETRRLLAIVAEAALRDHGEDAVASILLALLDGFAGTEADLFTFAGIAPTDAERAEIRALIAGRPAPRSRVAAVRRLWAVAEAPLAPVLTPAP